MRLLILGGTTEASRLARALKGRRDIEPILSLAGRTEHPVEHPIPYRVGGFGGIDGLAAYLQAETIDAIVDATHPFAAQISANADVAAARTGIPIAIFTRAPWIAQAGDDWCRVPDLEAAALALGTEGRKVFITSGRLGLSAFLLAPQHFYLVRSIDPPAPADCPPLCEIVLARGPFDAPSEEALMRQHGIKRLVTKNSGGKAGGAKLAAARVLGIPVVMIERPLRKRSCESFTGLAEVLAWIERHRDTAVP